MGTSSGRDCCSRNLGERGERHGTKGNRLRFHLCFFCGTAGGDQTNLSEVSASRRKEKKPPEEEEKLAELRKLDNSVTRSGTIAALLTGLCGATLHGMGTTLTQDETMFVLGTVIAIAGLAILLASYPIYCFAVKKQRRKVESQILKLCDELMK